MYEKTDIKKLPPTFYGRKWKLLYNICMQLLLTVHAHQEFVVVFGLLQTVFYEVHGFYRIHVGKVLAENPHAVQCLLVLQQVIAAGAGGNDVDSRGRYACWTSCGRAANSILPRTLEFFEDNLVHLRAGVNQGSGKDGQ